MFTYLQTSYQLKKVFEYPTEIGFLTKTQNVPFNLKSEEIKKQKKNIFFIK
jgi:hypothetical protein